MKAYLAILLIFSMIVFSGCGISMGEKSDSKNTEQKSEKPKGIPASEVQIFQDDRGKTQATGGRALKVLIPDPMPAGWEVEGHDTVPADGQHGWSNDDGTITAYFSKYEKIMGVTAKDRLDSVASSTDEDQIVKQTGNDTFAFFEKFDRNYFQITLFREGSGDYTYALLIIGDLDQRKDPSVQEFIESFKSNQ